MWAPGCSWGLTQDWDCFLISLGNFLGLALHRYMYVGMAWGANLLLYRSILSLLGIGSLPLATGKVPGGWVQF